jgi:hypothetical protein
VSIGGNTTEKVRAKRVDKKRADWFTIKEGEFLVALKRFKNLKDTASELGLRYKRVQMIKANILDKWERSVNTHNRLLSMCKGDPPFRKLMSRTVRTTPMIVEEQEEEADKWDEKMRHRRSHVEEEDDQEAGV